MTIMVVGVSTLVIFVAVVVKKCGTKGKPSNSLSLNTSSVAVMALSNQVYGLF